MKLCWRSSDVHGAHDCPRKWGHEGPCYWWLDWEAGDGRWCVMVYSGEAQGRQRRCKGTFSAPPNARDVHKLLRTISPLKKLEIAHKTPVSEPQPHSRPLQLVVSR